VQVVVDLETRDDELVMAVLLDSGFLFASLNASESEHQATIRVLENVREPIVLPIPANYRSGIPPSSRHKSRNRCGFRRFVDKTVVHLELSGICWEEETQRCATL
jgi:hypothetical protein